MSYFRQPLFAGSPALALARVARCALVHASRDNSQAETGFRAPIDFWPLPKIRAASPENQFTGIRQRPLMDVYEVRSNG
jgi:hypothetical protein